MKGKICLVSVLLGLAVFVDSRPSLAVSLIPGSAESAGTPRTILCTKTWGTCSLSQKLVPIHPSWKPASGTEGAMTVIDYTNRKIYDFYQVVTNPDGTVMINADGTDDMSHIPWSHLKVAEDCQCTPY
ncbi:MAG TPA: hypothetical protein VLQ45_13960 [Thermoanaerobaculia bacterium]|nr:hypothetical protein [Thermoanaerobaculia bacterium]